MIIVRLIGGIGNQMFQYALGRHLAVKNNTELKFDISDFCKYADREYMLGVFDIKSKIASEDEISKLKSNRYVKEKGFGFDCEILNTPDNSYIDGYWQNEKYFQSIENLIREDFLFKEDLNDKNKEFLSGISGSDSVCIHIRCGDYVSNLKTKLMHGNCSSKYYKKAVDLILQNVENPHFFVFSDEPERAKKMLDKNLNLTFVDTNSAADGYKDLRLMANCKHFIMANSSFSWWGAYLASNADKTVIAPKKWFGILSKNRNESPILGDWLKL